MKFAKIIKAIGLLLLASAIALSVYLIWDEQRADEATDTVIENLVTDVNIDAPDYKAFPDVEMPVQTIDGHDYIGKVTMPAIDIELPVMSEWNYPNLKIAPCRYVGSVYTNNLIICAHNYSCHFGKIKNLQPGDTVRFTDVDGNVFEYEVVVVQTLAKNAIEEMCSDGWDLTLFTCTYGGQTRVTVRCILK